MARILIVEDNQANMKLAGLLLRSVGHTVLCAVDAETGLTLARTEQPDLILMDIQLPGMDGLAATALLKGDSTTAAIPVIALTALAMKSDEERTRVAGCDAYIAKPLRYQELYAVIDRLLEKGEQLAGSKRSLEQALSTKPQAHRHEAGSTSSLHEQARRDGRLILVAEDNETNQKVIVRQLALLGFSADVAGDGQQALELWRNGNYALLLSDLQMPGMDGFDLIEAIRAQEQGQRIPIVVMTASSSKRDARRTIDMDDYLSKPLQLSELKASLEAWIPVPGADLPASDATTDDPAAVRPVDVSVLERLVGRDPELLRRFLDDFQVSAAKIASELRTACVDHEEVQARQQAHKLKSSALSVGALALGELCAEMEVAGKSGNTQTLAVLLPLFERELGAVNAFLESWQEARPERG